MERMLTFADQLFHNRYMIAIKKAFTITLPIIILGSIASLINNIPIAFIQAGLATPVGQVIRTANGAIWLGSTAVMALLIAWTLSFYLGTFYQLNGTLSALTGVSAYISICVTTGDGGISLSRLGAGGLFGAILISILATELYRLCSCFTIKVSEDSSEEVKQMFAALIPTIITVFCIAFTNAVVVFLFGKGVDEWIYTFLTFLFSSAEGGGLGGTLFLVFGIHIFWFFGIHGGNVMDSIMTSAFGQNLADNISLYATTNDVFLPQLSIINKGFLDTFVFMGGAGTSLCIIIAVVIVAKSRYLRSIAKMGGVFSLFNMNEIVLFGFPVILNPILLIPFLLAPLTITFFTYMIMSLGLAGRVVTQVHWAMPPFISGYLATGGHLSGSILQAVNIAIGIFIYLPFIRMMDQRAVRKEAKKDDTALLKTALNAVVDKIQDSTHEINGEILSFSFDLERTVEKLNSLTSQMNQQMHMLDTCTAYMETISSSVGNTDESIKHVLHNMEVTRDLSINGSQNMQQTTQKMSDIYISTQKVNELSDQLNSRCRQIEGILKSIEYISTNTTMLSINASVEAAHAGEHGKGFAAVASNIKKLSATTAGCVSDIEGLLQSMKADTSGIISQSQASLKHVEAGQEQVSDTSQLFQNIVESIKTIQTQCDTVLKHSEEVMAELKQIHSQVQTTNTFFKETAAQTTQVATLVGEKSAVSKEMVHKLQKLSDETNSLTENVLGKTAPDHKTEG